MALFPPSSASVINVEKLSMAVLKSAMATGGLVYAELFVMPSCTVFNNFSKSESDVLPKPRYALIFLTIVLIVGFPPFYRFPAAECTASNDGRPDGGHRSNLLNPQGSLSVSSDCGSCPVAASRNEDLNCCCD